MDLHESPRFFYQSLHHRATSLYVFRHVHYPLFSFSCPPTDDHLHIHAIIDFAVFISFKVERRFFLSRARAQAEKLMTFDGYAILHDSAAKGGEDFDFRRASMGVTRHNQNLIIDLMFCVQKN